MSYTKDIGKMVTSYEEIRQMIQTKKEAIKEDETSYEVETRNHLMDTAGKRVNISPQEIAQYGEKDIASAERRTSLQRFATKKQQFNCTNYQLEYSE